jgi:hypothetical protein
MTTTTYDQTDEEREETKYDVLPEGFDNRTVFQRMVAIIDELPAIGKDQRNTQQNFMFRGHDDVMNALNPLLAKHGVFVVPDVLERVTGERVTSSNKTMYEVNLHVKFTFFGLLGDSFVASGWGEGTDMGDKSTSKAMTMAFKYVVAQAFALATAETSDADAGTPEETTRGDVRRGRSENEPRQVREFDPGKQLLEHAVAVTNAEDAVSIRQAQRDLDPNQDWVAIEEYLAQATFGKSLEALSRTETAEWWKRLANAVAKAWEGGDFPPPTHEQVSLAYAWAFNGTALALSESVTASEAEPDGEPTDAPEGERTA